MAHDSKELLAAALRGESYLVFDGAMGSMLQGAGAAEPGEVLELLNCNAPEVVTEVHRAYVEAGAQVVTTNTFGAHAFRLGDAASVADIYKAGVACARAAQAPLVAASIGPTGKLLEPFGDLSEQAAYEMFAEEAHAAQAAGADFILIETMTDLTEAIAAVRASLDNSELPVVAMMSFNENGYTLMGTSPEQAAREFETLGVAACGVNCSLGPDKLATFVEQMRAACDCPIIVEPNAGLPEVVDGETVYAITPEQFAASYGALLDAGATLLGSCCGSTPEFTAQIAALVEDRRLIAS